jgi:hypothetical protein
MVGTNQVRLEITADNIAFPTNRQAPLTISCSIVADTLELPKFITSVVPEYRKFRRAK